MNTENGMTLTPPVNSIDPDGDRDVRVKAMILLKRKGYSDFQSPDWLAKNPEGKIETIEVKHKELYEPPPFWGIGLGKKQLWLRTQLLNEVGWRTYLINFVPETDKVYAAYLDELENKGGYYDTSGIRIYPLENYKAIHNAPNQM